MAADPAIEARLIVISEELRCLVCQNESLAGSRAELANDLREEVRKLIQEGKTDTEIKEYLVARYGDFVLYRPPVKPTTWLLWFGPFVLLAGSRDRPDPLPAPPRRPACPDRTLRRRQSLCQGPPRR
jgi:cytochrome c-type biogenesis protein CcmH